MRSKTRLLWLVSVVLIMASCKKSGNEDGENTPPPPVIAPPPAFGYYVVGYFPSYRNLNDIPDVKFRMCNVVNYAFFHVNANHELTVSNPAQVTQFINKARTQGSKVFVSINDEASDEINFKNMAATPTTRTHFVRHVMSRVRQYGFDGVDVDWEFPRTTDGTDITFTQLIKELSDSLHRDRKYYLTAAITAGKYAGSVRDAIRTEIFSYVDWFNIMSYDDFNSQTPYIQHSPYQLAVTSFDYWVTNRGMPKEKAVLGFPAYGRPSGISQSGTVLAYKDILTQGGSSQSDSALVTTANYPSPYTIYYNGQPTVKKKAMLSKQRGNGVMVWEMWHDANDGNSLLKAVCDTIGRSY